MRRLHRALLHALAARDGEAEIVLRLAVALLGRADITMPTRGSPAARRGRRRTWCRGRTARWRCPDRRRGGTSSPPRGRRCRRRGRGEHLPEQRLRARVALLRERPRHGHRGGVIGLHVGGIGGLRARRLRREPDRLRQRDHRLEQVLAVDAGGKPIAIATTATMAMIS